MVDLAERLGAAHLVTGHYARIVDDAEGPLLAAAADDTKDQSYMLAALPPGPARAGALPAGRADQARGARDRRPPRARGRQEAREPGPLLPRRPGQGATSCAATAACASARARWSTAPGKAIGRHRGHHNFTVGQRRGIGVGAGAALRARHRRGGKHGHGRPPPRADGAHGPPPRRRPAPRRRRVDAVRLRYRSQPVPAAVAATETGRHAELEVELGEDFAGVSPGPDRGAAARRDDRRSRHDRRRGLRP